MTEEKENSYSRPERGLDYADKAKAEECEDWCKKHKSCNLEITAHALENQKPE